ncbi:unnamed protein product [Medioppia subpectinata]|uniref:F-box domain-containing protein n=1 Tax=Medioppia subpectinata TaxID=1979941 RepID=A0A7R9L2M5_9ACAR|nr:unnamed protein product [Medioppia subpectinata]CAG2113242.1 unnamed protein product [Medioppia subpectinata]
MAFAVNYLPSIVVLNILRYLSPEDRLRASATCRTWRHCVFTRTHWPHKRFAVDVTDKRWTAVARHELRRNNRCNPTLDSTPALKCFLSKCCRFLEELVITFDPNSTASLRHLLDVIDILLSNDTNCNQNLSTDGSVDDNQWLRSNSRRLRRLTLNPINVTKSLEEFGSNENDAHIYQLFQQLVQRLDQLVDKCEPLEHISFGCLQPVLNHSNRFLQTLAKRHSLSLKCLHLSSVKTDPDNYPVLDLSVHLLEPFASLRVLSIDFDVLNDQMLRLMARKATIDTFVVNVHGIDEQHEGLSASSWSVLAKSNPNLKVTLNLIHTEDSIAVLRDSLLDTDMPLAHFRAYFVYTFGPSDDSICHLVNLVANRHSKTLLSVTLVNALKGTKTRHQRPNPVFAELRENPLVMLAWRSRQLQSLTIIGYEVCDSDLIAITRLRGSSLRHFSFPLCCISLLHSPIAEDEGYYDDYFDRRMTYFLDGAPQHIQTKVIEDIAQPLDRRWTPLTYEQLPNAVTNSVNSMQTTYLSTILRDQTICGESHHKINATTDTN